MATALAAEKGGMPDALARIRASLGANSVITERAALAGYVDRGSLLGPDAPLPAAAVFPENAEHVRSIVSIANEFRISVWPLAGSGKFAGSSTPAIVLDHKRMNRILEVNEEFAYALVEPG
ncbi:MAG: FAD-binding oxidoreductase, partial [Candidatus Binataceae bacterium]